MKFEKFKKLLEKVYLSGKEQVDDSVEVFQELLDKLDRKQ